MYDDKTDVDIIYIYYYRSDSLASFSYSKLILEPPSNIKLFGLIPRLPLVYRYS